jgi:predicted ribosome quality control (RQC) complex YloA/Tae2 family protein
MKKIFCITTETHTVLVGKNWQENEQLIMESSPCDVWFHLDDESSCHVVLKNYDNISLNKLSKKLIKRCALIVKHHTSKCVEHEKYNIVYTCVDNLQLVGHGSVEFLHDCVKKVRL